MIRRSVCVILFFVLLQTAAHAETIHYSITQMGLKAGEADLAWVGPVAYKGKDTLLVTFKADGFNFLDEEKIYLDPVSYKPLFVERNLNVFGKKEKISEEYATAQGEIRVTKTIGAKVTTQVLKKSGAIDNIYAFIYRYRHNGSFQVGDILDVNLPTKDLKIELVKRVALQVGAQEHDSFYMESKPSKYKIWFDSSDKKLPLRISGAMGVANTAMVMTDYKE